MKKVFKACKAMKHKRTPQDVMLKLFEEVGELSQEVNIEYGDCYKEKGKDGIVGEAADVALCVIDLLNICGYNNEELKERIDAKLMKWEARVNGRHNDVPK